VQRVDGLLFEGFDRDRGDVLVTNGLKESLGIGAVGFVSLAIASDMGGREQGDVVAEALELASPVVGGATGFHENTGWRAMQEIGLEASARETMLLIDPTGSMGHGNLEHGFCEIHGDLGSIHEDSSPVFGHRGR
jgi:hypothetical protein